MLVYGKCECYSIQMLYVSVHPVAFPNDAFCMTYSLLMQVEHARGTHNYRCHG